MIASVRLQSSPVSFEVPTHSSPGDCPRYDREAEGCHLKDRVEMLLLKPVPDKKKKKSLTLQCNYGHLWGEGKTLNCCISLDPDNRHPKQNFLTCIHSQVFIRQGSASFSKNTSVQKLLLQHAATTSANANDHPQEHPPRTAGYRDDQVTSQPLLASWGI